MIDGVKVKKLCVICDERGRLMEILRADDPEFIKFGQVYMTTVGPGVVKAWHSHRKQTDSMAVVSGMAKIVLYDGRTVSPTRGEVNEFFVGEHNPILVQIPQGVQHGMKGIGGREAIIINTVTEPYNRDEPDEYRLDPHDNDIPYDWAQKDG
ncbi:MAG: dTDP-4-dehydrorhamnose 3,5-epimerase family protein [Verrucomicrobia bacterium]|nr:dTDP-4-dehydrorhamnose 3,5-epimerase family protein [Verrucomicrobiota bacterium]